MTNKTFYCEESDYNFNVNFDRTTIEITRLVANSELETLTISAKVFKQIMKQLEIHELKHQISEIYDKLDDVEKAKANIIVNQLQSKQLSESRIALLTEEINELSVSPSETSNQIL